MGGRTVRFAFHNVFHMPCGERKGESEMWEDGGGEKRARGKNESFTQPIKKALKIGVTSRQLSKYCNE